MAHTDTLPDTTLNSLAGRISEAFPRNIGGAAIERGSLNEIFTVWMMPADSVDSETENQFSEIVENTGIWHLQIKSADAVIGAARATPIGVGDDDWQILEIFDSTYPSSIDAEIDWVDQNLADDPLVRILEIPSLFVSAFWCADDRAGDQFIVFSLPDNAVALRKRQVYTRDQFVANLRREPAIQGVIPAAPEA